MAAIAIESVDENPVTGWLRTVRDQLQDWTSAVRRGGTALDADLIDQIAALEQIQAAAAALQAATSVAFAQSQVRAQQRALDFDPAQLGRGIAEQLAFACHVSPSEGSRRLERARAWWFDLPGIFGLLAAGRISAYAASLVATETRHLDQPTRRRVDQQLIADRIDTLGVRSVAAQARTRAYQADPEGYAARGRTERQHRRVTARPAPDTMVWLSAYLPVEQGVACVAALKREVDAIKAAGDPRSRDQLMADTLVKRLTGQASATAVPVEIRILASADTLTGGPQPGAIPGHGPLPADLVRDLITTSDAPVRFTTPSPDDGRVSRARRFTGRLRDAVEQRDQTCRDPYCDAPIRHLDHIIRWSDGGPTSLLNGRGVCERGNYLRELPGWSLRLTNPATHTIEITTPTGHSYTSRPPRPP